MRKHILLVALLSKPLAGCSDYEFAGSARNPGGGDTASNGESTTDWTTDDEPTPPTDTAPPADTGTPPADTGTPPETSEDPCYEPEDGYDENPAARLFVSDSTALFTATLEGEDSDYDNEMWVDSPESRFLFRAWADGNGAVRTIGPYVDASELILGIEVTNTGHHWQMGPATRNTDSVVHVSVTYEGGCTWRIGFEDLEGGGDQDYNDAVMRISGPLIQVQ
jgi:Domain of unknown function (DUF4114)